MSEPYTCPFLSGGLCVFPECNHAFWWGLARRNLDLTDYDGDGDLDLLTRGFHIGLLLWCTRTVESNYQISPFLTNAEIGDAQWGDADGDGIRILSWGHRLSGCLYRKLRESKQHFRFGVAHYDLSGALPCDFELAGLGSISQIH